MKTAWRPLGQGALIILLTVVVYGPAMRGGFVFDDSALIADNPIIQASDGLSRLWFTTKPKDNWPLTSSVWWLEWRLWGNSATGYHVINVLLHAVNAVLVWGILRRLKIPGAWVAALVFAVHPVNVATVAWVSEQKNTLSMLFYAVAILLYLRFDKEGRWRWYGYSLGAFLLALLSKTAVVMLPVLLLGCVWWLHGRVRWKDFLCSVPFFALSLIAGLATIWVQHQGLGEHAVWTDGFSRLAGAGWRVWFYLSKTLLPVNLMAIYPKWQINASDWVSYVPGLALAGCFVTFWWKRNTWGRPLLFGLGYFVVTLFPVLGFFTQTFYQYSLVADHWQYHSIVGVIALSVAAGEGMCRRLGEHSRYIGMVAGGVVLLALAMATWRRGGVYANDEALWRDNVTKSPNAWVAHYNLGVALASSDRVPEAIAEYEQTLQIKPDDPKAHNNLGTVLDRVRRVQEASTHYEQALRLKPDYSEAHNNLGNALLRSGKVPEAIGHFEQALGLKSDYAEACNNLGTALMQVGKVEEAIGRYEQALRIRPDFAEAHYNLGAALIQLGKAQEAIHSWEEALRLKPGVAETHNDLGTALMRVGKVRDAVGHYEQALRIKPDFAEAHNNLGTALARLGGVLEAIGHFEQALRINPDYADAHYNLGIVLEKAGRVHDAVGHYEQALRINPGAIEVQNRLAQLRTSP